jgi:hypothetical protein
MKKLLISLVLILIAQTSFADIVGRYQAMVVPKFNSTDPTEIMILDTQEGHIWRWSEYSKIQGVRQGGVWLIYQGQVKPGKTIGDVIDHKKHKEK